MNKFPLLAFVFGLAVLAAGCLGSAAPSAPPRHETSAIGRVDGRLVQGGSGLSAATRPEPRTAFEVSSAAGGVYRITTDARGAFQFRGRPGTYYPTISEFGSRTDLRPFRVVAGQTTNVVLNANPAAWKSVSNA